MQDELLLDVEPRKTCVPVSSDTGLTVVQIAFDGGCVPNPGRMYGSYISTIDGIQLCARNRFEIGHGTNNVAEWSSLILALGETICTLEDKGLDLKKHRAFVVTDSNNVLYRLVRKNRIIKKFPSSQKMFELANQAKEHLARFAEYTAEWQPRELMVERFGH